MPKICRTCLKVDYNEDCGFVNLDSFICERSLSTKDKLSECIPTLSIDAVPDASICNLCLNALEITYEFISTCLRTEAKIRNFIEENADSNCVDLNSIVDLERSDIIEIQQEDTTLDEAACVEVECTYMQDLDKPDLVEVHQDVEIESRLPSEMQVEPELIDIKYMIPPVQEDDIQSNIKVEVDQYNMLGYYETLDYLHTNEEVVEVMIKNEDADDEPYKCSKCSHCFTTKGSLTRHMKVHVTSNKWKKPARKITTLPLKKLNEHFSRENNKEKSYMCDICGKRFLQKANLKMHMNVHSDKLYKCEICDKGFNFKNNLQRHMIMHEAGDDNRRFKCGVCEKSFIRKEHLSKHIISHTEGMPYQCTICNKPFKYKDSLRGHLKYHSGEKRFRCEICGNGFIRHDNLQAHLRTVHVDQNPLKCNICDEEYLEKNAYREHAQKHLNKKYYKCEICIKLFLTKYALQVHMNIHMEQKPHKCPICGNTFAQRGTLTYHMRTHTGEKPYTCFVCKKSFTQKSTLRGHLQKHRNKSGRMVQVEDVMP